MRLDKEARLYYSRLFCMPMHQLCHITCEGGTDYCAAALHTRLPMRRTATCGIEPDVAAEVAAVLARFRVTANPELTCHDGHRQLSK